MATAVLEDVGAIHGCRSVTMWDTRLGPPSASQNASRVNSRDDHQRAFARLASESDWTLLVAPEFDGILETLCCRAEKLGARLLSPDSTFIRLTSDKNRTAELLAAAGILVPESVDVDQPHDAAFPVVLKPSDGAGSIDVHRFASVSELLRTWRKAGPREASVATRPSVLGGGRWRVERWLPGTAASIAVLNGPAGSMVLPACRQFFSDGRALHYVGGATPLDADLDRRANRLGRAVLTALPPAVGYFGVDLILGPDPDGGQDAVVEVNPRLTTSYVGLRKSLGINLVKVMLDMANGEQAELPSIRRPVQFEADGTVRIMG